MERILQALTWLASVAVITGLAVVLMILANHGQPYPVNMTQGGDFGQPALPMLATFFLNWPELLVAVAGYLTGGAALAGVATTWAERQWVWMAAITTTVAATILFPVTLQTVLSGTDFATIHPRVMGFVMSNATLVVFLLETAQAAITLAYLLRHHRGVGEATRAEADAAMEITRTAL